VAQRDPSGSEITAVQLRSIANPVESRSDRLGGLVNQQHRQRGTIVHPVCPIKIKDSLFGASAHLRMPSLVSVRFGFNPHHPSAPARIRPVTGGVRAGTPRSDTGKHESTRTVEWKTSKGW